MQYNAVDDVHTRYMWRIMIQIGEWWYKRHSVPPRTEIPFLSYTKKTG